MNNDWKSAASCIQKLALELSALPRSELLALPQISDRNCPGIPAGFLVTVEHGPMLNGTSFVIVEAGKFVLFGFRWRSVIAGFEKAPDGQLQHYPLRWVSQSAKKRKMHLSWVT
jgi:hypothetical protein